MQRAFSRRDAPRERAAGTAGPEVVEGQRVTGGGVQKSTSADGQDDAWIDVCSRLRRMMDRGPCVQQSIPLRQNGRAETADVR